MLKLGLCFLMGLLLSPDSVACDAQRNSAIAINNGVRVRLTIPDSSYAGQPTWSPEDGEPPVSITEAMSLIQGWVKSKHGASRDADFNSLNLSPGEGCSGASAWHYIVYFGYLEDGEPVDGFTDVAAVMMDGSLILGEVE